MADHLIERARLLFQQNRYKDAESILLQVLAIEPTNVEVLAMMSEIKLQDDKPKEAELLIDNAIGLSPDTDFLYFIKAKTAIQLDRYDDAEKNLSTAISLNPYDADFYAFHASIKLERKQYKEALDLADRALEVDPTNILGLNNRSKALIKLDRKDESYTTIEGALNEDPNNAYTHTNYGWGLLEKGDHKKALVHFTEALKSDPNSVYAQAGMAEALKARYIVYRWFLNYMFWISNLTAKYQWGVILGYYFGLKGLRMLADKSPELEPFLSPLILLLTLIAFSTWVMTPISNLFLRLNKYGNYLLDSKEKMSSNFVGISFLVFILALIGYLVFRHDGWLVMAAVGFSLTIPLSAMFSPTKQKHLLVIYAAVMAVAGCFAVLTTFRTGEIFNGATTFYAIGIFVFQWVANFMLIRDDNK